jgi:hypothetical protein
MGSDLILGDAIREKARENIFSQWQGLIPTSKKIACPFFQEDSFWS